MIKNNKKKFYSVLFSMVATSHMLLLSILNMDSMAKEMNF